MIREKILCLVPLSPPITGAAAASETIVESLKERHTVRAIGYQRGNLISGKFSFIQSARILTVGLKLVILKLINEIDHVYLVISSTRWGNLRDLFILTILGKKRRKKCVVHLHGANYDTCMLSAPAWIRSLNRSLFNDVQAAIVLGASLESVFDGYVPPSKIKIVKNYFEPDLLIPEERIKVKFGSLKKIKILFLSNLIKEKGYEILLHSFLSLPENVRNKAELHFAGAINSLKDKNEFIKKMNNEPNIYYHGVVIGNEKKDLLWGSHVFCLPTIYKYEGQPISILEAYASGCCVIATNNGGIRDIFSDGKNGFAVGGFDEVRNDNLAEILEKTILNNTGLIKIAHHNRSEAMNLYKKSVFSNNVGRIILEKQI
jgi:glycosyltransferase involved in cell wall biosynthesis